MTLLTKAIIKLSICWFTFLRTILGYFKFIAKPFHYLVNVVYHYARQSRLQEPVQATSDVECIDSCRNLRTRMVIGTSYRADGATMMGNSTALVLGNGREAIGNLKWNADDSDYDGDISDDADDADISDDTDNELEETNGNEHGPERNSGEPRDERFEMATEQVAPKPVNKSKKKKAKQTKRRATKPTMPSQTKRRKPVFTAKQQKRHSFTNNDAIGLVTWDKGTMQQYHPVKRSRNKHSPTRANHDSSGYLCPVLCTDEHYC